MGLQADSIVGILSEVWLAVRRFDYCSQEKSQAVSRETLRWNLKPLAVHHFRRDILRPGTVALVHVQLRAGGNRLVAETKRGLKTTAVVVQPTADAKEGRKA